MSTSVDLSTRALISLPEARRFVFRDENDGSRDELLVDAVNMVSDAIWDHCKREFADTTAVPGPDSRSFSIGPGGWVDLSPYDLRVLTEVVRYTDREASLQQTLTSSQYRLHPAGRTPEGTYLHLQLGVPSLREEEPGFGWQATVTGEWGMLAVPPRAKLACRQWVKNVVENPGAYASHEMSGYTVTPDVDFASPTITPAGMPAAVRYRLARLRRFPVVM